MSGTGNVHQPPYIRCDDRFFGHWSTVPGEYVIGMPDIPSRTPAYRASENECASGLPV